MTVKYGKFEMPSTIKLDEETASPTFGRFIAEAFQKGFAHTVGNPLRRTLLSALETPAIIGVRIEGVQHEYMTIEGVIEDMINILLNFKGALLRKLPSVEDHHSKESRVITTLLEITQQDLDENKGQYQVTLGDVITDSYYEVVNPQLPIFRVTKPMKRQIDLRVCFGRGYVPSERHVVNDKTADEVLIDAAFSPIRLVNYYVENTRVGQDTDYDRLVIEVTTDGRVSPSEAISFASQIVMNHFSVFSTVSKHHISFFDDIEESDNDHDELMDKLALRIDEIELSVRSTNCLSGANIETIAELVSIPERRMLEFRNFGKKSLNEIKAKLSDMNLSLGMDLSRYGLSPDNIREKVRIYQEEKKKAKKIEEATNTGR